MSTTVRIPIAVNVLPDTTGECWVEDYAVLATNDVWHFPVFRFGSNNAAQPTLRNGFYGCFTVPKDYVAGAKIIIVWSATLTSGNVVWDFEYRTVGGDDTTSLDQAGTEESLTVTDAAPGAANRRLETSITLTAANLAADELVEYFFARDGADGADTMAGSSLLFDLLLEYTT